MGTPSVVWLDDVSADDARLTGGKASRLAQMRRAGLPVPRGFVLSTVAIAAHQRVAAPWLAAALGAVASASDFERLRARAEETLTHAPLAPELATAAIEAYRRLVSSRGAPGAGAGAESAGSAPVPSVVVRSSGVAEDAAEASFAGQFDSFLGIRGEAALLQAIARCVASLWSPRAAHYRGDAWREAAGVSAMVAPDTIAPGIAAAVFAAPVAAGPIAAVPAAAGPGMEDAGEGAGMTCFGTGGGAMAVIVQEQAASEVSGVLFTANPIAGRADELVITASYGLGDAIVSGDVTPDTMVVDAGGEIRERRIGEKAVMSVDTASGCELRDVPRARRAELALSDQEARRLARLGQEVARLFGAPQDIEWGLAGGQLLLFQSRPITTQAPAAGQGEEAEAGSAPLGFVQRQFLTHSPMLANFADHFPDPLTALDFTTTVRAGLVGLRALFGYAGLRMKTPDELCPPTRDGTILFRPQPPRPTWELVKLPYRLYAAWRLDAVREWTVHDRPRIQAALQTVGTADPATLDMPALLARTLGLQEVFEQAAAVRFRKYFSSGLLHTTLVNLLLRIVTAPADLTARRRRLYLAIPHHTAVMNGDLIRLCRVAEEEPAVAVLFRDSSPAEIAEQLRSRPDAVRFRTAFAAFLARYGSRSAAGMVPVVSHPTWAETPDVVLGLLQALLRQTGGTADAADDGSEARTFEAARAETAALLARGWGGWLRLDRWFLLSLERARNYLEVREASLHEAEVHMVQARALAFEIGRRFAASGILRRPEDIFHVRTDEIVPAQRGALAHDELQARVTRRVRQHRRWREGAARGQNWAREATGLAAALRASAAGAAIDARPADAHLTGLAASPGHASGPARLVLNQREFHKLRPGDVLVCPATAPAWTPLFRIASAVVTDVGGPLSHAAIVARELGIPAVLGTGRATTSAHDGQTLYVDGTAGRVLLREPDGRPA